MRSASVAIIGGGPAGLMAAEVISQHKIKVDVYDAMPSVGRKFLMAGKSGLNLTHAEPLDIFLSRYGKQQQQLESIIQSFNPDMLRDWAHDLGIPTFIGSSRRVFPTDMKAAPLLRAWVHRLRSNGVRFHMRHKCIALTKTGQLRFTTTQGDVTINSDATVLALGGGSWSRLGSTGEWVSFLAAAGIDIAPLQPSNCGFDINWSAHLRDRYAGQPIKTIALSFSNHDGVTNTQTGDVMLTQYGIEGGPVYALAAEIRDAIATTSHATVYLDLLPGLSATRIRESLSESRGKRSLSEHLRRQLRLGGIKTALLYEVLAKEVLAEPDLLAQKIKALPILCERPRPIDEAISTAGGIRFDELDRYLMLKKLPGVFCAGEMLDWDAPTGGYLLTACFASGVVAGHGVVKYLIK